MKWIEDVIGARLPAEGEVLDVNGRTFIQRDAILRDTAIPARDQAQTRDMFAYKWSQRDSYGSATNEAVQRAWLVERYGDLGTDLPDGARVLDAGCGAGYAARLLFAEHLKRLRYAGVDISDAVEIARETLRPVSGESFFLQGDILSLPFQAGSFDAVISEGVMHHTRSTREAMLALARLVKPGGVFAFYVYALKAPLREFSDDHIRARVADMTPEEAWTAIMPLSLLGKALGELDAEIDVPEDVDVLGIPAGRISVQRLFYYYICKAYYRPEYGTDEMNHINFDWFTPKYCHRQSPEQVRLWCEEAGLTIREMKVELSGITVLAVAR